MSKVYTSVHNISIMNRIWTMGLNCTAVAAVALKKLLGTFQGALNDVISCQVPVICAVRYLKVFNKPMINDNIYTLFGFQNINFSSNPLHQNIIYWKLKYLFNTVQSKRRWRNINSLNSEKVESWATKEWLYQLYLSWKSGSNSFEN